MKRTQEEIVARIQEISNTSRDPFGFEVGNLIERLDYEHAKDFLNDGVTKDEWEASIANLLPVRETMIDYLSFAWEKANDERGLSAYRSLAHYTSWLWLDGDDHLWKTLEHYTDYGKPQLISICNYLGVDWEPYLLDKYS